MVSPHRGKGTISDVYDWGLYNPIKKEVVKLEPNSWNGLPASIASTGGKYRLVGSKTTLGETALGRSQYELYPESELSFLRRRKGSFSVCPE